MKTSALGSLFIVAGIALLGVAGCGFLKPTGISPRSFVLTALSDSSQPPGRPPTRAVGLGFVKLPDYLHWKSMAMRRGANEVVYLETARWAERLDRGLQRVIAANLTTLLPALQIRLSAWRPGDVSTEVYVTVEQFDVDAGGQCVLIASWRMVTPAGEEIQDAGRFRATRQGPPPDSDPEGATRSMSELVAEISQSLAEALEPGAF
jgi:uncharacterized lipoprotein YmbA